jgi:YidC/Oxa1 family membrane protein insertase
MDKSKVLIAILLSTVILVGWPLMLRYFNMWPSPTDQPTPMPEISQEPNANSNTPSPSPALSTGDSKTAPSTSANGKPSPGASSAKMTGKPTASPSTQTAAASSAQAAQAPTTQVAQRDLVIETQNWRVTLSNRGAVATSWMILKDGDRIITAADGSPLELIPQQEIEHLGAPLRMRLPWSPELAEQLNRVNFQVEGVNESPITLKAGEQREIVFTYSSPTAKARKTFKFSGDKFLFETTAEVTANGSPQPVELVIGPRIGDQMDKQTGGSYSTPPQVVAYNREGKRLSFVAPRITPAFAKVTQIDEAAKRIQVDKPLAPDVDSIRIVGGDGKNFITHIGYARVVGREPDNKTLTLDAIPQGASIGNGVGQGMDTVRQNVLWAGVVDHYFGMLAIPPQSVSEIVLTNIEIRNGEQEPAPTDYPSVAIPVSSDAPTRIFVGPKDRQLLASLSKELNTDFESIIDYGFFGFIVRPIVPLLGFALDKLGGIFHNFGWGIVVVTALVNLVLFPMRWYSSKKMKQAAKHQPRMKELQDKMKRLKESPKRSEREMQELQREQMELMKEANPMGGCLPMLLQMPIFWSFFIFLTISLDMRHAPWILWVKDLSKADPLHILPIIMCVTMIASTALMPQPPSADPAMKFQRMLMTWLMPIMLTWFFFLSAPSGLVLYWMVSNIVGVAIQLTINKLTAEPEAATANAASGKNGKDKSRKGGQEKRRNVEA